MPRRRGSSSSSAVATETAVAPAEMARPPSHVAVPDTDEPMHASTESDVTPVKPDRGDYEQSEPPTATASTASTDSSASTASASSTKRTRKRRGSVGESPAQQTTKKKAEAAAMAEPASESSSAVEHAQEGTSSHSAVQVLETGHLYFLFRPKVDHEHATRVEDVQRLLVLMSPDGVSRHWSPHAQVSSVEATTSTSISSSSSATEEKEPTPMPAPSRISKRPVGRPRKTKKQQQQEEQRQQQQQHQQQQQTTSSAEEKNTSHKKHRLLVIPSKTFPAPVHSRVWAFVERSAESLPPLDELLEEKTYETATRGEHHQPPVRIAGEAKYQLVKHADSHTHLIYELEVPAEPDLVQRAFHISKSGSFLCMVKNPNAAGLPNQPVPAASERAAFPASLMARFHGVRKPERKFTGLDPVNFLDYEHCELVLLHVNRSPADEFPELAHEFDRDVAEEEQHIEQTTHHHPEKHVYEDVKLDPHQHPNALHSFV